jgi:hypothetical protein
MAPGIDVGFEDIRCYDALIIFLVALEGQKTVEAQNANGRR